MSFIYALADPDTSEIRYVGQALDVKKRFSQHLIPSQLKHKNKKNSWIKGLQSKGKIPRLRILDQVPDSELDEAEIRWIAVLKASNCRLTNMTIGGRGTRNLTHSEETKALMSAAHKKRLEDPAEREILRQRSLKYGNEPPHKKGSEVPNAVFTEEIVIRIRREIRAGDKNTIANLAKEFGVSYQAVHLAATGQSWAHVDEPFVKMNPAKKLTEEDIREIRKLLKEGNLKQVEIAKRFNVDQSHISNIKNNKRLNTARRSLK